MPETIDSNAGAVAAVFDTLADAIANPEPLLRRMQALIARDEQEVFATQGRSLGAAWAPAVDPDEKTDSRMLVMTGALMQSVTSAGAGRVEGDTLIYDTNVPYAAYLEFGTSRMVARPFLGLTNAFIRSVEQLLSEMIEERFAE